MGTGTVSASPRVGSPLGGAGVGEGETRRRSLGRGSGAGKGLTAPGAAGEARGSGFAAAPGEERTPRVPGNPVFREPALSFAGTGARGQARRPPPAGAALLPASGWELGAAQGGVFLRSPGPRHFVGRPCAAPSPPVFVSGSLFCPVLSAAFLFSLHRDLAASAHPAAPFSPGRGDGPLPCRAASPHFPAGASLPLFTPPRPACWGGGRDQLPCHLIHHECL